MRLDLKREPIAAATRSDPMTRTNINRRKSLRVSATLVLLGLIASFVAAIFHPSRPLGYVLVLAWGTWLLVIAWQTRGRS
jgi:hypothetical protein